jgi:predicted protein tyrosine phosphatase
MRQQQQQQQEHNASEEWFDSRIMGQISPGLYIGNLWSVKEIRKRKDREWTVISLIDSDKLLDAVQRILAEHTGSKFLRRHDVWALPDRADAMFVSPKLQEIMALVDDGIDQMISSTAGHGRSCLVHCALGISRSAAVCAAWLLHHRREVTLPGALSAVRIARPDAQPNIGFIAGLRAIEQCNGDIEGAMERLHLEVPSTLIHSSPSSRCC